MEEIKVNEYVRTKNGQIYKIEDGTEFYEDSVNVGIGIIPDVDGIWVDKEHFTYVDKREIVKHSSNPIDILKIGDFIHTDYGWGWYHHKVDEEIIVIDDGDEFIAVKKDEIHRILTQEMLWNNSYELKE